MEIKIIHHSQIVKGYNPRKNFLLDDLISSIKKLGILVPVLVRKKNDRYEIVSGEQRWRVANKLKIKIPCIIRNLNNEEAANIAYIDNQQRGDLSPIEEAKHFAYMRDYYAYSAKKLADKYNIDKRRVIEYWAISKLPNGATWHQLDKRHLYEISKLVDEKHLVKVYEESFGEVKDKWNKDQEREYQTELKSRQEEQIKLANIILESEWTVKQTEREVRNLLYRFSERDKHIKLKEEQKVMKAINSLKNGISTITNTVVNLTDGLKDFSNISEFFSEDLFKKIPKKNKDDLLSELDDLEEELNNLDIKEVKKDISYFKSNIGGKK